jgi:hypothetical protein
VAVKDAPSLQRIGAWAEEPGDRMVALTIWKSHKAFQEALGLFGAAVANVPFEEWEARPRELVRAEELLFVESD